MLLRKSLHIYIDFETTCLLDTEQKLHVDACAVGQRRAKRNCARRPTAVKGASIGLRRWLFNCRALHRSGAGRRRRCTRRSTRSTVIDARNHDRAGSAVPQIRYTRRCGKGSYVNYPEAQSGDGGAGVVHKSSTNRESAERGVIRRVAGKVAHAVWRIAPGDRGVEQILGNCAVALNRRGEILRPRRSQALPGAGGGSVGVDKNEIGCVVVCVLGRANRARPKSSNAAAFAALITMEGIVDRKRRQGR